MDIEYNCEGVYYGPLVKDEIKRKYFHIFLFRPFLRIKPRRMIAGVGLDCGVLSVEELYELLVRSPCLCPCQNCGWEKKI